ncbi:hypothetical protein [Rahnella variigena]|jgi:hypothetical protein|uniref:hypothetical protein n=1 Tax=Rahnella variigena TaxID=574964 RepID=UPI000DE8B073|nr:MULTISPECIES: hypothetical protein [Rahnella]RBQ33687.1 hypothetical protein C2125_13565 [Rahnella aquatilis]
MTIMVNLKSVDGTEFILKREDLYLIISHGGKTKFFIKGYGRGVICNIDFSDLKKLMKKNESINDVFDLWEMN